MTSTDRVKKLYWKYPVIRAAVYPAIILRRFLFRAKGAWQMEVFDNLSELLQEDPVIRFKEFEGVFAVDARSHLFSRILFNKSYEPQLVRCCLKYIDKKRDIIDVGANIGFYTVLFAKNLPERKVISIEPSGNALKRLRRNIELNSVKERVEIFQGVASNRIGAVEIKTIAGKEEYSTLGKMKHPAVLKSDYLTEKVMSITIDELVKQKSLDPGFIKVDVEGAEHLVFEGAQNVLKNKRPVIVSELSGFLLKENGASPMEVIDLIRKHEYDVFDPADPSVQPGKKDFGDILCFPKERGLKLDFYT